jgi:adenylosuccinate synthase
LATYLFNVGLVSCQKKQLDILDGLDYVKIGVAYKLRGQVLPPGFMPSSLQDLQEIEVVYEGKTFACFSPTLVINLPWQA